MAKSSEVLRALDLFADELTRKRHVVGLGRVPALDGDGDELAVYVDSSWPEASLDAADRLPECVEVPCRGGRTARVRIQVIEQGPVTLEPGGIGKEPIANKFA